MQTMAVSSTSTLLGSASNLPNLSSLDALSKLVSDDLMVVGLEEQ